MMMLAKKSLLVMGFPGTRERKKSSVFQEREPEYKYQARVFIVTKKAVISTYLACVEKDSL